MPVYRNELKHVITVSDAKAIAMNLSVIAKRDPHTGPDGQYRIRSLYLDDLRDTALREKLDGVSCRQKFRIRYYNDDTSFIMLEKKVKEGGAGYKLQHRLTREQVESILNGETSFLATSGEPLLIDFYLQMKNRGLRPKVVVQYDRIPFVYEPGNVRVTIDFNVRAGKVVRDFLNPDQVTIPVTDGLVLLEVKWDDFLPGNIRNALQLRNRGQSAFSKYAQCRIFG